MIRPPGFRSLKAELAADKEGKADMIMNLAVLARTCPPATEDSTGPGFGVVPGSQRPC